VSDTAMIMSVHKCACGLLMLEMQADEPRAVHLICPVCHHFLSEAAVLGKNAISITIHGDGARPPAHKPGEMTPELEKVVEAMESFAAMIVDGILDADGKVDRRTFGALKGIFCVSTDERFAQRLEAFRDALMSYIVSEVERRGLADPIIAAADTVTELDSIDDTFVRKYLAEYDPDSLMEYEKPVNLTPHLRELVRDRFEKRFGKRGGLVEQHPRYPGDLVRFHYIATDEGRDRLLRLDDMEPTPKEMSATWTYIREHDAILRRRMEYDRMGIEHKTVEERYLELVGPGYKNMRSVAANVGICLLPRCGKRAEECPMPRREQEWLRRRKHGK